MKKLVLALVGLLALSACGNSSIPQPRAEGSPRDVRLAAIAPDGTRLWKVYVSGEEVFFASSGTQHTVTCGKNCVHTVFTPTATAEDPAE